MILLAYESYLLHHKIPIGTAKYDGHHSQKLFPTCKICYLPLSCYLGH